MVDINSGLLTVPFHPDLVHCLLSQSRQEGFALVADLGTLWSAFAQTSELLGHLYVSGIRLERKQLLACESNWPS